MSPKTKSKKYDLVIIGGGAAGMTCTVTALGLGARTLTVENTGRLGGECSWTGCVPSKTLIHLAELAHLFKIHGAPQDFIDKFCADAMRKTREKVKEIASGAHGQAALIDMGAEIVYGNPKVCGEHKIEIDGEEIETRFAIICTGSDPVIPPVPGLRECNPLTNKNIFDLEKPPKSLTVIGGGPIGIELAQAFHRLGTKVSVLGRNAKILPKDDHELADELLEILRDEGIDIKTSVSVEKVDTANGLKKCHYSCDGENCSVESEEILVATGRKANLDSLDLACAGLKSNPKGLKVNQYLQTDINWIYAAGDVIGQYQFAHAAEYEGIIATKNAFFPVKEKVNYRWFPWATFTDPEPAHIGLIEEQLKEKGARYSVYHGKFEDDDRARAELKSKGQVKILSTKSGKLLGAHILGHRAGELMNEFVIAAKKGATMSDIGLAVHIYPTLGQAVQHTAVYWFAELGDKPWVKYLFRKFTRKT